MTDTPEKNLHDLPAALAPLTALANWVLWRFEVVNGKLTAIWQEG
jgi:hypothetical protein